MDDGPTDVVRGIQCKDNTDPGSEDGNVCVPARLAQASVQTPVITPYASPLANESTLP